MFAVRADEDDDEEDRAMIRQRARERGMDEEFRTKMQEIGPRMTLKLRWIKKGTLSDGRRKAGGQFIGQPKAGPTASGAEEEVIDLVDEGDERVEGDEGEQVAAADGEDAPAVIDEEAAQQLADEDATLTPAGSTAEADDTITKQKKSRSKPKNKHSRTTVTGADGTKSIKIPQLSIHDKQLASDVPGGTHRIKRRKQGGSILDGISLQGGMRDDQKEWAWKVCLASACGLSTC